MRATTPRVRSRVAASRWMASRPRATKKTGPVEQLQILGEALLHPPQRSFEVQQPPFGNELRRRAGPGPPELPRWVNAAWVPSKSFEAPPGIGKDA